MPLAAKLWLAGLVLMLAAVVASFVGISMVGGDTFSTVRIGSVGGVAALGGIEIPDSARRRPLRERRGRAGGRGD
jgi:hypothetical protein